MTDVRVTKFDTFTFNTHEGKSRSFIYTRDRQHKFGLMMMMGSSIYRNNGRMRQTDDCQ